MPPPGTEPTPSLVTQSLPPIQNKEETGMQECVLQNLTPWWPHALSSEPLELTQYMSRRLGLVNLTEAPGTLTLI